MFLALFFGLHRLIFSGNLKGSYLYSSLLGSVISVLGFIFQVFCFFLHVSDGSLQLAFGLRKSIRLVLSRRQVFDRLLTLLFGLSTETLGLSKNKNASCLAYS